MRPQYRSSFLLQTGLVQAVKLVRSARNSLDRNADPVPCVDGHDLEGQVGYFLLGKLAADLLIKLVRNAGVGKLGDRFRPRKGGALARAEQRRFTPGGDVIETEFTFAMDLCFLGMHVHAEAAAI